MTDDSLAQATGHRTVSTKRPSALRAAAKSLSHLGFLLPVALIALGLGLRIYGYNFDDGTLIHPDESAIDQAVYGLGCCLGGPQAGTIASWPSPFSHFFDPALAPYNPHFFNYGSLPMYLLALVTRSMAWMGRTVPVLSGWQSATDIVHVNWTGRVLSALFGTASLAVLYRLGLRMFDRTVALVALALMTLTVLDIQLAHFYAVDTVLTFFVLLALWSSVVVAQDNRRWAYIGAGAAFGAAMATKTSAALLLLPLLAAPILFMVEHAAGERDLPNAKSSPTGLSKLLRLYRGNCEAINANLAFLLLSLIAAVLVFAITEPYGLIDHAQLVADVQTQNGIIVTHSIPTPYTIQFVGTTPYFFYIKNLILWYMGPALGIAACAGLVWALVASFMRRPDPARIVLFLWVIPYFVIVGKFWAKFGRYMLPIMPILVLFGAALAVTIARRLAPRWGRVAWAIPSLIVVLTAGWALAFMHIYEVTNTQVAASRWIYANIRPGTVFATEGAWDRSLPLCLPQPGQCPQGYNSYQMNLYDSDNGAKVSHLVYTLTHARYIVMSTERFVDSIPREPTVYPITTRYYQLLFGNKLNFRQVKRFQVHPQLGPWVINDFPADENFHVFDHPDVRIFKRVGPISPARATYLLTHGPVSSSHVPEADGLPPRSSSAVENLSSASGLDGTIKNRQRIAVRQRPSGIATVAERSRFQDGNTAAHSSEPSPTGNLAAKVPPITAARGPQDKRLMLTPSQWAADQNGPTYDQMFPPRGFGMSHPILVWLLLVELIGLAMFPAAFFVFRGLSDRGWVVAKTLGLIFAGWLVWVIVSLSMTTYSNGAIWAVIAVLGLGGAVAAWAQRVELRRFITSHVREILWCELVFLAGFVAFVLLRMWYPDLGHQFAPVSPSNPGSGRMGEKQLELAFLTAITRSRTFPPLDPFFAGGYINYYYFGYVIVATLARAVMVAPPVAFNLAIATFFALLLATSYSIGRNLTRSIPFGLVTAVFVGCIGNLNGLIQAIADLQSLATVHIAVPLIGGAVELSSGIAQAVFAGQPPPPFDFWQSTRLVPPVGIDFAEFPYFTYLFGDLHAHLMAFPMTLGVIALAYSSATSIDPRRRLHLGASIAVAGVLLGAIEATNSLDFPTYLIVFAIGVVIGVGAARRRADPRQAAVRRHPSRAVGPLDLVVGAILTVLAAGAAVLLFPPLTQGYHPVFNTGLSTINSQLAQVRAAIAGQTPGLTASQIAQQTHDTVVTPLSTYWEIFGLFLFVAGSWVVVLGAGGIRSRHARSVDPRHQLLATSGAVIAGNHPDVSVTCGSSAHQMFPGETQRAKTVIAPTTSEVETRVVFEERSSIPAPPEALSDDAAGRGRHQMSSGMSLGALLPGGWISPFWLSAIVAGLAVIGALCLIALSLWLLAFLLVFACLILWAVIVRAGNLTSAELFVLGMLLLAVCLTAFSETMFVPDYLSGGLAFRMNTVAKLYNQIWVLYAIGAAAALSFLWKRASTNPSGHTDEDLEAELHQASNAPARTSILMFRFRSARAQAIVKPVLRHPWWSGICAVLVFGSLIYTYAGTVARETYRQTWLPERSVPFTLDGMAFMKVAYPNDYAGINWLNAHVRGARVIVEADQAFYNWRSRVVQFTGLPTLLGGIYESAQRYGSEVAPRQAALEEIYSASAATTSVSTLQQFGANQCEPLTANGARCLTYSLLHRYHVSYVYAGLMERQLWPGSQAKFSAMSKSAAGVP